MELVSQTQSFVARPGIRETATTTRTMTGLANTMHNATVWIKCRLTEESSRCTMTSRNMPVIRNTPASLTTLRKRLQFRISTTDLITTQGTSKHVSPSCSPQSMTYVICHLTSQAWSCRSFYCPKFYISIFFILILID